MVFQATKWGWKRIAARLLLVPVLAGGSAAIAHAQMRPAGVPANRSMPPPPTPKGKPAPATKAAPAKPAPAAPAGDPKAMLKEGRKALAEGRFNDAQDLARRAEAVHATGKWGLFDDTPNALLKDVQAAVAKAHKAEAEQLVKQAKTLLTRPAATDTERAANLDTALQMARRADSLHGPYSAWDFGTRADKLAKEIEAERSKVRTLPPPPNGVAGVPGARPLAAKPPTPGTRPATVVAAGGTKAPGSVTPAGGTKAPGAGPVTPVAAGPKAPAARPVSPVAAGPKPANPAVPDARKAAALKLMAEGKQLADKGDFAAAHAKFANAGKVGATFAPGEPSPGFALQELGARGAAAIDRLLKEARDQQARKEYAKSEAALNAAADIAGVLGLFPRPIEEAKTALRLATKGQYGGVPVGGLASAGGPEKVVPLGPAPVAPPGVATVTGPKMPMSPKMPAASADSMTPRSPVATAEPVTPKSPVAAAAPMAPTSPVAAAEPVSPAPLPSAVKTGNSVTGRQLLDQATIEYRKGDFDLAEQIARKAFNAGSQDEARSLLNQIDAERLNMRKATAVKSLDAAAAAAGHKDHGHALGVLVQIDPNLLPPDLKRRREELITACQTELDRTGPKPDVATAALTQPPPMSDDPVAPKGLTPPGTARVTDPRAANPDSMTTQADAMRKVAFQKLRGEGLKVLSDAQAAFGRGETDVALNMLAEYGNRVRAAGLEPPSVALLMRPIDSRVEMFKVMKGQADALAREKRDNREAREMITGRGAAEEQRKAEVTKLVRQYHALVKESKFAEAERVAMQAKQLDPDDPAIGALAHMAKMQRRVREAEKLKSDKEQFVLDGLNNADKEGPLVTVEDPVAHNIQRQMISRRRGSSDDAYLRSRTPEEFRIETQLDNKVSVEFNQTPLSEVVENLRTLTGLPFSWDTAALEAEQISTAKPISEKLPGVSARNALHLILDKAGLSFVIEYDSVRITTLKKAKGRLVTKVFSVADLVTPIPNFALPEYANFDKMLTRNARDNPNVVMSGLNGSPSGGLQGGVPAGTQASMPGIGGDVKYGPRGGTLENNPLAAGGNVVPSNPAKHEQLMKLVTGMVRPYSWDAMGGPGRIEYFDLGSALVVNQTADVIREIQDLLEALRRLQDLAVAVEVRIISLSETWFERMGVDFSMNVKTHNTSFEPALTSGLFRPEPYINDINNKGVTVGLTPAGTFTPDLDVPIRATSFQYAIPGFGGYPNTPGMNGGVSLGLAFLNDIQVYMFMEAAQGDRRVNVMQAPKLTMFNGQSATITVAETQFFVTNVQVFSVNGQIVFVPQNSPLPGPGDPLGGNGLNTGVPGSISVSLQAVVSADRRFVRINIPVTLSAQTGATVPLFPVTTFITPVFEGGSQGVPIPFTQFLQQPAFTTMQIQTTVVAPDGGTVLLGGLKSLGEGRNEFGPPFLSKIPYLNRLFKNVGIGRETRHMMIMITPRIIINSEEEINQTEGAPLGSNVPGR